MHRRLHMMSRGVTIPLNNIVSEWRWDSGVDSKNDSVGTNDGIQQGSIAFPTGVLNECISFTPGSTSAIIIPYASNLTFGDSVNDSPFSITTLFNSYDGLSTSKSEVFIDKRATDNSGREYLLVWSTLYSGSILFRIFDTTSDGSGTNVYKDAYYTLGSVASGSWHHVTATYDGINMKLYYDGVDVTTNASSGNYTAMGDKNIPITMGKFANSTSSSFKGYLDTTRIWNTALTSAQAYKIATDELAGIDINP